MAERKRMTLMFSIRKVVSLEAKQLMCNCHLNVIRVSIKRITLCPYKIRGVLERVWAQRNKCDATFVSKMQSLLIIYYRLMLSVQYITQRI